MNRPEADIALIRKYHNGELSPAEKNSLEAMALNNPFLQDALDGFEEKGVKEQELLSLVARIDNRTEPAKVIRPIWGVKQWGIAASILLCIAVGTIYFKQPPKNKTIALNEIQRKEDIPPAEKAKIAQLENPTVNDLNPISQLERPAEIMERPSAEKQSRAYTPEADIVVEPMASSTVQKNKPAISLDEVLVVGYGTQKKESLTGSVSSISSADLMGARMVSADRKAKPFTLKGKTVDENGSHALPGVIVKNVKSGEVTLSDANGNFAITANEGNDLAFDYIGYETKKAVAENEDPIKIALTPSRASLSEVVVVGYGTAKRESNILVGPKVGWKLFKTYLEEQAANAKMGRGKVQVQFLINPNGDLSDFKILNTFTAEAGVAAIDIIKNYDGGWAGSPQNVPHKTNITITFK